MKTNAFKKGWVKALSTDWKVSSSETAGLDQA